MKLKKRIGLVYQIYVLIIIFPFLQTYSSSKNGVNKQKKKPPIEVSVELRVNKIYNINSVNESYQIDAFLIYTWYDESVKYKTKDNFIEVETYQKDSINELRNKVWVPEFEIINLLVYKDDTKSRVDIFSNGKIILTENINGSFVSKMDFTKFPFDSQTYLISIESFSKNIEKLIFKESKFCLEPEIGSFFSEEWDFIDEKTKIVKNKYHFLKNDNTSSKGIYSRVIFEINAKRASGNYLWKVLFPVIIISLFSFIVFWIKDFKKQIGYEFFIIFIILVLNFYKSSLLPKLPYNTVIDNVIMVGYIFIFLSIIAVTFSNRINRDKKENDNISFIIHFKYLFPLLYGIVIILLF